MKKYIIAIITTLSFSYTFACDACGCAATGGGLGFSSILDKKYVGLRYINQSYRSKEGIYNNSPYALEQYNTLQAWLRFPLSERIDIIATLPYQKHLIEKSTGKESIEGLGDISTNMLYNVFDRSYNDIDHNLNVGTGVKVPTGTYNKENKGSINPSFQLGTGSWDVNFLLDYQFSYKKWGVYQGVNYQLKTKNQQQYQFGNQANYQAVLYRVIGEKLITMPSVGVIYEHYTSNKHFGEELKNTSGALWMSKIGVDMKKHQWSISLQWYTPLKQQLMDGNIIAKNRFAISVNYNL